MKTIYRTDDGLEFENLAEAEDHEANLLEKENRLSIGRLQESKL